MSYLVPTEIVDIWHVLPGSHRDSWHFTCFTSFPQRLLTFYMFYLIPTEIVDITCFTSFPQRLLTLILHVLPHSHRDCWHYMFYLDPTEIVDILHVLPRSHRDSWHFTSFFFTSELGMPPATAASLFSPTIASNRPDSVVFPGNIVVGKS